jgi:hypothetical protein
MVHQAGHDVSRVPVIGLRSRIGHEQIMTHTTDILVQSTRRRTSASARRP